MQIYLNFPFNGHENLFYDATAATQSLLQPSQRKREAEQENCISKAAADFICRVKIKVVMCCGDLDPVTCRQEIVKLFHDDFLDKIRINSANGWDDTFISAKCVSQLLKLLLKPFVIVDLVE